MPLTVETEDLGEGGGEGGERERVILCVGTESSKDKVYLRSFSLSFSFSSPFLLLSLSHTPSSICSLMDIASATHLLTDVGKYIDVFVCM